MIFHNWHSYEISLFKTQLQMFLFQQYSTAFPTFRSSNPLFISVSLINVFSPKKVIQERHHINKKIYFDYYYYYSGSGHECILWFPQLRGRMSLSAILRNPHWLSTQLYDWSWHVDQCDNQPELHVAQCFLELMFKLVWIRAVPIWFSVSVQYGSKAWRIL